MKSSQSNTMKSINIIVLVLLASAVMLSAGSIKRIIKKIQKVHKVQKKAEPLKTSTATMSDASAQMSTQTVTAGGAVNPVCLNQASKADGPSELPPLPTSVVAPSGTFTTTDASIVYKNFRTIESRRIVYPNGDVHPFEVLKQTDPNVVVVPWNLTDSTTTMIREYHPGQQRIMQGTVAGMYELKRHTSALDAAQHELEEEAHLACRDWYQLSSDMAYGKYIDNGFYFFLAVDCHVVPKPTAGEPEEEGMEIIRNVSMAEFKELIRNNQPNMPSTLAYYMAKEKLEELGYLGGGQRV